MRSLYGKLRALAPPRRPSSHSQAGRAADPRRAIPDDILMLVASRLVFLRAFGTLATLSRLDTRCNATITPVLYRSVELDAGTAAAFLAVLSAAGSTSTRARAGSRRAHAAAALSHVRTLDLGPSAGLAPFPAYRQRGLIRRALSAPPALPRLTRLVVRTPDAYGTASAAHDTWARQLGLVLVVLAAAGPGVAVSRAGHRAWLALGDANAELHAVYGCALVEAVYARAQLRALGGPCARCARPRLRVW
ncbi:hypothetical protein Q5752_004347 [Cryptotrichosporon argae]